MREPGRDLHDLAREALEQQGLDPMRVDEALQTVASVTASPLWQRAGRAEQTLVEVPFTRCLPAATEEDVPTLLRGVIDLAFLEAGGWVIVDYKTDAASPEELPRLAAHYEGQVRAYRQSWVEMTGQAVKEAGLYFTRAGQYVTVAAC
jgi:ATP-dependent exoDNAse (exonuclease V) beta subunit